MFVGTLDSALRPVLREMAEAQRTLPAYIGGSGNFTIERIFAHAGIPEIHGCDVSLYSCAVGRHAAGGRMELSVRDLEFEWLEPYLNPGPQQIATIMLLQGMLGYRGRREPYHQRMWAAYRDDWDRLHKRTVERVEAAIQGLCLASFSERDLVEFIADAPEDSFAASYPPTYAGGYEKQYRALHDVFGWTPPSYQKFDEGRLVELIQIMQSKRAWALVTDRPMEDLDSQGMLRAVFQKTPGKRSVYVYGQAADAARVAILRQKTEEVPCPRIDHELVGPLRLAYISQAQLNLLRAEYLGKNIVPAQSMLAWALLDGRNRLIGALAFQPSAHGAVSEAYLMSDFAVHPTGFKRLSKLVSAAALTKEVKNLLEAHLAHGIDSVLTTAFTAKAESMKYRGLFDKVKRAEGHIQYRARAGRWTLEEALAWWTKEHAQT